MKLKVKSTGCLVKMNRRGLDKKNNFSSLIFPQLPITVMRTEFDFTWKEKPFSGWDLIENYFLNSPSYSFPSHPPGRKIQNAGHRLWNTTWNFQFSPKTSNFVFGSSSEPAIQTKETVTKFSHIYFQHNRNLSFLKFHSKYKYHTRIIQGIKVIV